MNKKIKNSLNSILPNDQEKEIMLNNILQKNNKKTFYINYKMIFQIGVLGAIACFCIILSKPGQNNTELMPNKIRTMSNVDTFYYNNKCYEESEHKGLKKGRYLFTISSNNELDGRKVYESENKNEVIVLDGNEQKEFRKCK